MTTLFCRVHSLPWPKQVYRNPELGTLKSVIMPGRDAGFGERCFKGIDNRKGETATFSF